MCCRRELRELTRSGEAGRLREACGFSQEAVAGALGIAKGTLWDLEHGRYSYPDLAVSARYMRVLRALRNHDEVTRELAAGRKAA